MNLNPRHSVFDLDSFFDGSWFSGGRNQRGEVSYSPKIDVQETATELRVSAELPGCNEQDISVSVSQGVVVIEALVESDASSAEGVQFLRSERQFGRYFRRVELGCNTSAAGVVSCFKNGVLYLSITKDQETD